MRLATPSRRGFTLVELIAVLVVLGIMAAVAASKGSALGPSSKAAQAARMAARDVSYARERAMCTGLPHWVQFDSTNHTYTIKANTTSTANWSAATTIQDPARNATFVVTLNRDPWTGVTLGSTGAFMTTYSGIIGFSASGRPLQSNNTAMPVNGVFTLTGASVSYDITIRASNGSIGY